MTETPKWDRCDISSKSPEVAIGGRIDMLLLLLLLLVIYCPTYKPQQPGITKSIKSVRHNKMNVKIISFKVTFKTVLVVAERIC